MNGITVAHIFKTYNKGAIKAVNDVCFDVKPGELFGLIGPDGAGKTSLIRMLATLLLPDKGMATVAGFDVVKDYKQIRARVGYMPGKFSLYQDLTVQENLDFFAAVFGTNIKEHYDLIRDIYDQIKPFSDRRAGKLSGGMKQKLALCCALIHKPEVLLLDEPTTGVDVVSRREFWEMLKTLRAQGISILVSTPYMDEASLCERIALMQNGVVMSVNTPDAIRDAYDGELYAVRTDKIYPLLKDLRANSLVQYCYAFGDALHVGLTDDTATSLQNLQHYITERGYRHFSVEKIQPGIEDCFIQLTNRAPGVV